VDTSRKRDESVERLLRQSPVAPATRDRTDSCPDAETLGAWIDGGLSGTALEMAQSHVADCARCQSIAGALVRTGTPIVEPKPEQARRRWLAWLIPLTATAFAVAVWVAVPRDSGVAPRRPAALQEKSAAIAQAPAAQPAAPPATEPADQFQVPRAKNQVRETRPAAGADSRDDVAPQTARPQLRDAAVGGLAAADNLQKQEAAVVMRTEIVSPNAQIRWRIAGQVVDRSSDGGVTWEAVPTGVGAELTAGAAPSTTVCWLVGRGGVVLLSIDGRSWRRVPFPESSDLMAVRAVDARVATVSTADGRIFSTSDGGATWNNP
jgi:hypothetical protein